MIPTVRVSVVIGALLTVLWLSSASGADAAAGPLERLDQTLDRLGQPVALGRGPAQVTVGGELRYRLEVRDDFTFNDDAYEDDTVQLLRTRLYANLTAPHGLRLFVQGQDSESFAASSLNQSVSFVNRLDVNQLFMEAGSPWETWPVRARLGRQELAFGDGRFVGNSSWSNVARVFDAARLTLTPRDTLQLDAWFSQVVLTDRVGPDGADHGENFYGLYGSARPLADHVVDAFLFIRHDRDRELVGERAGARGSLKEYTLGNRLKGRRGPLDYGLEWAWQFGSRAHDAIRAWAWHQEVGYTEQRLPGRPRVHAEFNHGSGDSNPTDGTVENFDILFPSNHSPYGHMDFASLRNITHVELGVESTPVTRLTLSAAHHWFFLDTNKSAWFNSGQGVIRAATPNASRTVGQELDLLANWRASEHLSILLGYAHFHAGAFVADSGASDDANFFYTQTALRF